MQTIMKAGRCSEDTLQADRWKTIWMGAYTDNLTKDSQKAGIYSIVSGIMMSEEQVRLR